MLRNLVAITGNIATGKSYVAEIIRRDYAFAHVDADKIGHRVLTLSEVKREIRDRFGDRVFAENGEVDRAALGAIVFGDRNALDTLDAITHPRIIAAAREEVRNLLDAGHRVLFEAAVLFEAGWERDFPVILLTICHHEEQVTRLVRRLGCLPDEARRVIAAQMPQDEKIDRATYVIDTTHGPRAFRRTLDLIMKDILRAGG